MCGLVYDYAKSASRRMMSRCPTWRLPKKFGLLVLGALTMFAFLNYGSTVTKIDRQKLFFSVSRGAKNQLLSRPWTTPHPKWIVLTTIQPPTADVRALAKTPGWKVVVVGDVATPASWSYPGIFYLNISTQEALGFELSRKLPKKSYTRKILGYLFAMAHGAEIIYETDDDNRPMDNLKGFHLDPTVTGLLYQGKGSFNPFRHFGQPTIWPRGGPLSAVGWVQSSDYLNGLWPAPSIQQGLVNGDPDVDAIFRLTRKLTDAILDVNSDPVAPPAILPPGTFSPFNSQNTLFRNDAFWAMFLPTTTTFRMCDIWRSYWAQRLLWEVGGTLAFYPPNGYQMRNSHSYMADAEQEETMYYNTDRLIGFLEKWSCPKERSFFSCVILLTFDMADEEFWKQGDVHMVQSWISDLISVGYKEPKRVFSNKAGLSMYNIKTAVPGKDAQRQLSVQFVASEQVSPIVDKSYVPAPMNVFSRYVDLFLTICPTVTASSVSAGRYAGFKDTLLIIIFNVPLYDNVNILEALYRPVFPNIAYCGEDAGKFKKVMPKLESTFIEVPIDKGTVGYMCASAAIDIGYNVSGYFVINDDTIINPWNFQSFRKDKIWMMMPERMFKATNAKANINLKWWSLTENNYLKAMTELKADTRQVPSGVPNVTAFMTQLQKNTNGKDSISGFADIFYIPRRLANAYRFYIEHFARNHVFLEVSTPMVLYGLDDADKGMEIMNGSLIWADKRKHVLSYFNADNHLLHPVKLSEQANKQFICTTYADALFRKVASFQTRPGSSPKSSPFSLFGLLSKII